MAVEPLQRSQAGGEVGLFKTVERGTRGCERTGMYLQRVLNSLIAGRALSQSPNPWRSLLQLGQGIIDAFPPE